MKFHEFRTTITDYPVNLNTDKTAYEQSKAFTLAELEKFEHLDESRKTPRKQLAEIRERKTRQRATRQKDSSRNLVEYQSKLTSVKQIIDSAFEKKEYYK